MTKRSALGFLCVLVIAFVLRACQSPDNEGDSIQVGTALVELSAPAGFPAIQIPENNPITQTKVALGKRLFFDKALSSDSSVSCASCHLPSRAFADSVALSAGVEGQFAERNSPSLINVAFHPHLMREGGVPNLELQVITPLESPNEMNMPIVEACKRLNRDTDYVRQFQEAFGDSITPFTLTRAIAAYERTLLGGNSPYDQFVGGDSNALSAQAQLGLKLFASDRLQCTSCHSGVFFTDFSMQNNGTYAEYKDNGLFRLTLREQDIGKFKVPSLRNVAVTVPYMFDGSFATLDSVITHYARGGHVHPNKSKHLTGFDISEEEREALISFLESLTEEVQP